MMSFRQLSVMLIALIISCNAASEPGSSCPSYHCRLALAKKLAATDSAAAVPCTVWNGDGTSTIEVPPVVLEELAAIFSDDGVTTDPPRVTKCSLSLALLCEWALGGRYGCFEPLGDADYSGEYCSPVLYNIIEQGGEEARNYARFLCALFSLNGLYNFVAPAGGKALPAEVEGTGSKHPLVEMQKLAEDGCVPEAATFLQEVYKILPRTAHGDWEGSDSLASVVAKSSPVDPELQAEEHALKERLSKLACTYLMLSGAPCASTA